MKNPFIERQYQKVLARHRAQGIKRNAAFTLFEVILVISGVLALVFLASLAGPAFLDMLYKGTCIMNQSTVQKAVRAYAGGNQLDTGAALASTAVIGAGNLIQVAPVCKSGGTYTFGTTVPAVGTRYVTCNRAGHVPTSFADW